MRVCANDWQRAACLRYSLTMKHWIMRAAVYAVILACARTPAASAAAPDADIIPPPTAKDYQALAKLPDWSGVWTPVISDQVAQEKTNRPPWTPQVAKQMQHMYAEEKAGRP